MSRLALGIAMLTLIPPALCAEAGRHDFLPGRSAVPFDIGTP